LFITCTCCAKDWVNQKAIDIVYSDGFCFCIFPKGSAAHCRTSNKW
jgi:hypothetical protein